MSSHSPFARGRVATFAPTVPDPSNVVSFAAHADALRDAAVRPHTQWSTRQAAILELHTLTRRLAWLTPGSGYSERAVRRFVAKLKRVSWYSNGDPEICGELLGDLDACVVSYLEAFEQAYAETSADELAKEAA
jgi:hypothetical protein